MTLGQAHGLDVPSVVRPPGGLRLVGLSVWTYRFDAGIAGATIRLVERQGWIGGHRALSLLPPDNDTVLIVLANTEAADVSQTYAGRSFSEDLVRAALAPD